MAWLAVIIGAICGAILRWRTGIWLSNPGQHVPLGTLLVNWAGAYIMGFLVALFAHLPHLGETWRLLLITGFLGTLTTFSAFSAEAMILLQRGEYLWFFTHSALHLVGSILLCIAGYVTFRGLVA